MEPQAQQSTPPQWVEAIMQQMMRNQQAHGEAMEQFTTSQQRMVTAQEQHAATQERLSAAQGERIRRLEEMIAQQGISNQTDEITSETVTEQVRTATETPSSIGEPYRRPRARLPDPVLFAGSVNDWPTWRITMENKLAVDGEAIGATHEQFMYVFSRLEKLAWKNTGTYVKHRRNDGTPEELLDYLEKIYGDPNAQARAARRLHQINQSEGMAFSKFLPRLEKEFADAGALEWPDEAKRQILLGSLNRTMSNSLMNRGIPATFQGLISRLHEISTDMDALNISKPPTRRSTKSVDEMDWTPTVSVNRVDPHANHRRISRERHERPKRAQWVSEEEISSRREEGRCLRCGKPGCWISECPLLPARRPEQKNRVAASKPKRKEDRDRSEKPPKHKRTARINKSRAVVEEDTEPSSTEESVQTNSESENE